MDLNPCSAVEVWRSASLAAQQHGEATWKHLTCCDSEAFIQMSTSSASDQRAMM